MRLGFFPSTDEHVARIGLAATTTEVPSGKQTSAGPNTRPPGRSWRQPEFGFAAPMKLRKRIQHEETELPVPLAGTDPPRPAVAVRRMRAPTRPAGNGVDPRADLESLSPRRERRACAADTYSGAPLSREPGRTPPGT
jgi:hypothetical protein